MRLWKRPRPQEQRRQEFEQLAKEHTQAFMRSALRLTSSPSEAEDLCQEALIKAYSAFDQFSAGSNFRAWVLRIMANTHISRYRSRKRLPQTVSWEEASPAEMPPLDPPSAEATPEEATLEEDLGEELGSALAALPDEFRLAVIMSDLFDLSYKEIAGLTGAPLGTVRSRIFRGRKLLRRALSGYARTHRLLTHQGTR
jgi:RNA polymerase sigma-70 factor (ECF subfamily)